jgi:DNA-binding transcriptional MerR regulator
VAPDSGRELISIGRFARLARLTRRQLRYYHALGLLLPAEVDPQSGYRYYADAQRATAELIALLRSIDMPLPEIQSLLEDRSPANVRAVFDRLRATVEQRLQHAREILDRIESMEETLMEPRHTPAPYPYDAFTEESREVLLRAQALAEEAGHGFIGTEHLLAALAGESAGAAGRALRGAGLDTGRLLGAASAVAVAPGDGAAASGQLLPNDDVRGVIAGAFADAGVDPQAAGEQVIDTSNLLRRTVAARGASEVLRRLDVAEARVLAQLGG